ncbi:FK506-binding protein 2 [Eufriesea mexicana]|uniref:peptidylprolyl isomerase n=1 Tax=Eufriesea mexicana TaxID=516756 RepID=A0A310SMA9_9HYME|nr:FK506-binding protein 2 [Eufriesea mexicana]
MAAHFVNNNAGVVLAMCRTVLLIFTVVLVLANADQNQSGLKVEKLYVPEVCDAKSKIGDQLTMHYTGTLQDGTKFDSSISNFPPCAGSFTKEQSLGRLGKTLGNTKYGHVKGAIEKRVHGGKDIKKDIKVVGGQF